MLSLRLQRLVRDAGHDISGHFNVNKGLYCAADYCVLWNKFSSGLTSAMCLAFVHPLV